LSLLISCFCQPFVANLPHTQKLSNRTILIDADAPRFLKDDENIPSDFRSEWKPTDFLALVFSEIQSSGQSNLSISTKSLLTRSNDTLTRSRAAVRGAERGLVMNE
jgi:hypothetical protein